MEKNRENPETGQQKGQKKKLLDNYLRYSGLALQLVVLIVAGVFAGIRLDELFPSVSPLFKLIFALGSVAFSMYYLIRKLSRD